MRYLALVPATLLTGCLSLGDASSSVEGEEGPVSDADCECKIEGDQIGRDGVILRLTTQKVVTFVDWIPKSGSPGEYAGFKLELDGASTVSYVVKTGGELYPGTSLNWIHPSGAEGGSRTPAISNVDLCDDPDYDNDNGGSDDGSGDGGGDGGPIIIL